MSCFAGPHILQQHLVILLDVNNPRCIDAASNTIATMDTRLVNLGSANFQFKPNNVDYDTMQFSQEPNGQWVYHQLGNHASGGSPTWLAESLYTRTDNYTFMCWFKYQYGSDYQRAQNIYSGGFNSQSSFYLSSGGTSYNTGFLRYSDIGSTDSYSHTAAYGVSNNTWHCLATVDYGGDGAHTTKFYIDGELKYTANSNATHDTPDGDKQLVWCSWSVGYGCFDGYSNLFTYYDVALDDSDILLLYDAYRTRFI